MGHLLETDRHSWVLLVQRLVLAVVMFAHGAQKLFGWFGGGGFDATMTGFQQGMGIPAVIAFLVIMAESVGSLMLAFGFLTRLAALGITCNMIGAILLVHRDAGFFIDWNGDKGAQGFEFHLLALALSVPLMIKGAGAAAIDTKLLDSFARGRQPRHTRPATV